MVQIQDTTFTAKKNMRTYPIEAAFAKWVLQVGSDDLREDMKLSKECIIEAH